MDDQGVSDIVGTIILIGVTVTFVAAAAIQLTPSTDPPLPMRLAMTATANATAISLLHQGGATLDEGTIRAQVTVNGTLVLTQTVGPMGTLWTVGSVLAIPLASPLPSGPAEITLIHVARAEVIASASITAPMNGAAVSLAGFALAATLNGTLTTTVTAPGQALAAIQVTHPEGRKMIRYVYANLTGVTGPPWVALRDDGTHGDVAAADATWSGLLDIPFSSPRGDVTLTFTAVDLRGASATTTAVVHVV